MLSFLEIKARSYRKASVVKYRPGARPARVRVKILRDEVSIRPQGVGSSKEITDQGLCHLYITSGAYYVKDWSVHANALLLVLQAIAHSPPPERAGSGGG